MHATRAFPLGHDCGMAPPFPGSREDALPNRPPDACGREDVAALGARSRRQRWSGSGRIGSTPATVLIVPPPRVQGISPGGSLTGSLGGYLWRPEVLAVRNTAPVRHTLHVPLASVFDFD